MASYRATWPSGVSLSWRDLTWQEYEDICGTRELSDIPPEISVAILETCVLDGPARETLTAGAGYFIANQQVSHNPFSGNAKCLIEILNDARNAVKSDYLLSAQAMVCNVFDYKIEEVKSWTPSKFFMRVAQAEVIVGEVLNPAPPPAPKQIPKEKPLNMRLSPQELAKKRHSERNNTT
jgi:hypothetical protein